MTDPQRRVEAIVADRERQRREAARRGRRDASLRRHAAVLVLLLVGLTVVTATRTIDAPERAAAEPVAEAIDAAFDAWRTGTLELGPEPRAVGDRLTGATVELFGELRYVVTGEAAGECYAAAWNDEGHRQARVLASNLPCQPSSRVVANRVEDFDRVAAIVRDPEQAYPWDRVLPPPQRDRYLFWPVAVLLGSLALATVTRIVTILITGQPAGAVGARRRRG